ncbi:MAG: penicillin acylase family protein [Longimicrobiales bacterium]
MRPSTILRFLRTGLLAVLALSASGCTPLKRGSAPETGSALEYTSASITRDRWGVPWIDAPSDAGAAYALAYAMAEDGYVELEDTYARALGRAAAWYGESEVESDVLRLSLGGEAAVRAAYARVTAAESTVYRAFADGLNDFMRRHPERPPRQIVRYEPWMVFAATRDAALVAPLERLLRSDAAAEDAMVARAGSRLLSSGSAARPYELDIRTADGWRIHGFAALGSAVPAEGFTSALAFAPAPLQLDSLLDRVVVRSNDPTVEASTYSLRVNTATGVVTRNVRVMRIGRGVVVAQRGDTAFVLGPEYIAGDRAHQLRAVARAEDAAAVAVGGAGTDVLFVDATGAANFDGARSAAAGRAAHAARLIEAGAQRDSVRFKALAFDTEVESASAEIRGLVDEWEQVGAGNPERAFKLDSAIMQLRAWNGRCTPASTAAALYASYIDQLRPQLMAGSYARFLALETVIGDTRRYPPRAWRDMNAVSRPAPPGSPTVAALRIPTAAMPSRYGTMFAYEAGERMQRTIWWVDLSTGSAASVMSYGQSWESGSPHWFDQAVLFAGGAMKPVVARSTDTGGTPYRPFVPLQ